MVLAVELFGRDFPSGLVFVAIGVLVVAYLVANRNAPNVVNTAEDGEMHRCERCGRNFQIEKIELLDNGDVHRHLDDHCPGCGWDVDWGDPHDSHNPHRA